MNHRDTEPQRINALSERTIGFCIEVHRALGPGLLENAYEECVCFELASNEIAFKRQVSLPVTYKGIRLDCGYRLDLVVEDLIVVEFKAVERVLPVHEARLLTYLKLTGMPLGLLVNFNVPVLKDGITRRKHGTW